jgi:tetratricopeptide (TPR) repeat protein
MTMQRLRLMILLCTLVLVPMAALLTGAPTLAQDADPALTSAPTSDPALPPEATPVAPDMATLQAILRQVQAAADEAHTAAEDASRYAGDASSFLNIFEALGVVITVAAAALGLVGFRQLFQIRADAKRQREEDRATLTESLADLTAEVRKRQSEIDAMTRQLLDSAKQQQQELIESRARFEQELERKEREVNTLKEQIQKQADVQREDARKTTLALSLLSLGERQYRSLDYQGSLATYERALELDEDNPIIHYRLGYIHFQMGHVDDAQMCLEKALAIEPNFPPATAALGYIFRRRAEKLPEGIERELLMNRAEAMLLTALKASPTLMDEDGESWWGSLGGLYRRRNQLDQAIHAYREATKVTPFSSYPFGNLAMLYSEKRDSAATLKAYEQVERLARDEAQAEVGNFYGYADLLTARLVLGKVKEAEEALESVFYTAPASYALQSLVDTLERLRERLGGEKELPQLQVFAERIRAEISRREAGTMAETVIW